MLGRCLGGGAWGFRGLGGGGGSLGASGGFGGFGGFGGVWGVWGVWGGLGGLGGSGYWGGLGNLVYISSSGPPLQPSPGTLLLFLLDGAQADGVGGGTEKSPAVTESSGSIRSRCKAVENVSASNKHINDQRCNFSSQVVPRVFYVACETKKASPVPGSVLRCCRFERQTIIETPDTLTLKPPFSGAGPLEPQAPSPKTSLLVRVKLILAKHPSACCPLKPEQRTRQFGCPPQQCWRCGRTL